MRPMKRVPKKSFLERMLLLCGIEPSEKILLRTRIIIVILSILLIGYMQFGREEAGSRYGNYDEVKDKLR